MTVIERHYESLTFPADDIRRDFHGMVSNSIRSFYAGHIASELAQEIGNGNFFFKEELIENRTHFDNLSKIYTNSDDPIYSLNRHVIIGCWTSFEVSLTTLSEAILPKKEKDELSLIDYAKARKILKGEKNIKEETLKKLETVFYKKHLTHVQVWRKFSSLVKYAENSKKNTVEQERMTFYFLICTQT